MTPAETLLSQSKCPECGRKPDYHRTGLLGVYVPDECSLLQDQVIVMIHQYREGIS